MSFLITIVEQISSALLEFDIVFHVVVNSGLSDAHAVRRIANSDNTNVCRDLPFKATRIRNLADLVGTHEHYQNYYFKP